ncbi:hypothetical protein QBC35DRAFT_500923 [Podospora australis]|uniref:Uncharacterized protein n=1 Tax=Podospora australis TaxID=1536484 RepID=A0AAN6WQM5_9PEZI|nr:hypothetical protein QBC35DRAFT_500923 [Podospora australis]
MASFSRGLGPQFFLLLRQQPSTCARCINSSSSSSQPLNHLLLRARFSSSPLRLAIKSKSKPSPSKKPQQPLLQPSAPASKPKANISPLLASARVVPSTFAEQLAVKGRTILYESPSHLWFRIGCFSSAAFCVSYTVYQYWTILLHPPPDLYWWIPHAFGVICVFMAGMGMYFVLGTGRIVRSITAVPAASIAKLAKSSGASPIYIEVTSQRMAPFLPPKKKLYLPDEVQLPFRMLGIFGTAGGINEPRKERLSLVEQVRAARKEIEDKKKEREYTMNHLMTAPFRDAKKAFGGMWSGIKRSFSREGFAKIKLGEQEFKLDVMGGWALDDGRAMDRLLAVRPNALSGGAGSILRR